VIEERATKRASLFVEYVGDYPDNASPVQVLNSGGVYRLSPTPQINYQIAVGLNQNAPNYMMGFGYSFRFDGLFASTRN
jgi:hypothetical protein